MASNRVHNHQLDYGRHYFLTNKYQLTSKHQLINSTSAERRKHFGISEVGVTRSSDGGKLTEELWGELPLGWVEVS